MFKPLNLISVAVIVVIPSIAVGVVSTSSSILMQHQIVVHVQAYGFEIFVAVGVVIVTFAVSTMTSFVHSC